MVSVPSHSPGMRWRDHLRRLLDEGIKPRQLIYTATVSGVFDALRDAATTASALAQELDVNPTVLTRLIRALVALELLEELEDRMITLAPAGRLLCHGTPESLRGEVLFTGARDRAWTGLLDGLRSGQTPFRSVFGEDLFTHVARDADLSRTFQQWMATWSHDFDSLAQACPLPETGHIIDAGGGRGDLLVALLRRFPELSGTLVDAATDTTGSMEFITAAGLAHRCRVEPGNFFAAVPPGGDVYVLCRILHDWDDGPAAGPMLDGHAPNVLAPCARDAAPGTRRR